MNRFSRIAFVDESARIVLRDSSNLCSLPFERIDDNYIRLTSLPPIKHVSHVLLPLIGLTVDGRLIVVDNNHPDGVYVDTNLPPIKMFYETCPITVLDYDENLHFLNDETYLKISIFNFRNGRYLGEIDFGDKLHKGPVVTSIIHNVKDVKFNDRNKILIFTDTQLIQGDTYAITKGVVDNLRDEVYRVDTEELNLPFTPYRRLLMDNIRVVEDENGILYKLPTLEIIDLPVKLYRDDIRNRMTKSARSKIL